MLNLDQRQSRPQSPHTALPRVPGLPDDLLLSEYAVANLRAHLEQRNLGAYRIFQVSLPELSGIDHVLDLLDPAALWEQAETSLAFRESIVPITFADDQAIPPRAWQSGYLHLRAMQIVVARWYWHDAYGNVSALMLVAASRPETLAALRTKLRELRRIRDTAKWQIMSDHGIEERVPRRTEASSQLVLDETLRQRVETEVIDFFTPTARRLHERLNVPYRRGVLMYGDPGNGKTSLIRSIGARLPGISAIILRAGSEFNTDSMSAAISAWKQQAPAMLVIEDINFVLERVNISTFLNLLDGVDQKINGGLLLLATTNHPRELDPALSNRPGRFDVAIELPNPDEPARLFYLASRFLEIDRETVDGLARDSSGFSFAHLEEVVRLSGLIAARESREVRNRDDVLTAMSLTRDSLNVALSGFAKKHEAPFGLRPR